MVRGGGGGGGGGGALLGFIYFKFYNLVRLQQPNAESRVPCSL